MWDVLVMGGKEEWNIHCPRAFNDPEVEVMHRFLEKLSGVRLMDEMECMVVWPKTKNGRFSV